MTKCQSCAFEVDDSDMVDDVCSECSDWHRDGESVDHERVYTDDDSF